MPAGSVQAGNSDQRLCRGLRRFRGGRPARSSALSLIVRNFPQELARNNCHLFRGRSRMSFTYSQIAKLKNTDKVGSHQCVALVQTYAGLPHTSAWKPGVAVMDNQDIVPGTAIATFVRGRYLSAAHGNHAAFFLRRGVNGFWVVDQWTDQPNKTDTAGLGAIHCFFGHEASKKWRMAQS